MYRIRNTVLAITAALVIAACSGSETSSTTDVTDPASSVDTAPVATDEVDTTTASTTTGPVVETTPDTTVESVEADPPTTVAETITTAAADTPEAEVVAAIEFFEAQWETCLNELPSCDQVAATVRRQGEEVANVQSNALRWNQNDYRASNVEALDYQVDEVSIDSAAGTAVAVVCVIDPVALTEADGTVVDDNFYSSIVDWNLELVDDVWTSTARTTRGEAVVGEEGNLCA